MDFIFGGRPVSRTPKATAFGQGRGQKQPSTECTDNHMLHPMQQEFALCFSVCDFFWLHIECVLF